MTATPIRHDLLWGAYRALIEDLCRLNPSVNRKAVEWDLIQLDRLARNRGQRYFTIDLPEFGKVFERSLSSGALISHSVPGFAKLRTRRGRDGRPRLFWAFLSRVFRYDGRLRDSPCVSSIFAIRQLCYLVKKIKADCDEGYTYATIADLYETEEKMDSPSLDWNDPDAPLSSSKRVNLTDSALAGGFGFIDTPRSRWVHAHGAFFQRVFDLMAGMLPEFDPFRIVSRHGPGAVSDLGRGKSKFSFPSWPDKLEQVFPYDWHASTCFMQGEEYPPSGESYSKLEVVPKSQKGPRLIASEPTCNQWIQQGIAAWFIESFRSTQFRGKPLFRASIRIDDQTHNQQMSRKASEGWGSTIDLSSASDRLSCYLVERVFRRKPELLSAMIACRTSYLSNSKDKRFPKLLRLKKFSTMGSALTFPVQSYVFYTIAVASLMKVRGLQPSLSSWASVTGDVAVYGDDIVISSDATEVLVESLTALGLKVNTSKTHQSGYFRESCGSDWYKGECVTPAYIRDDFHPKHPASLSTTIESANNFLQKRLPSVSRFLLSRVPESILRKVAVWNGSAAVVGFYTGMGPDVSRLRRRYNRDLHRYEYKVLVLDADIGSGEPDGVERLRQYFTESPDSTYRWRKPLFSWSPKLISRPVPVFRERYVPLYSGI